MQENLQSASNLKKGDYESKSCAKNIFEDAEIFSKVDEERIALDIKSVNVAESISMNLSKNRNANSAVNDEILSMNVAECKVADTNFGISNVCDVTSVFNENSISNNPTLQLDPITDIPKVYFINYEIKQNMNQFNEKFVGKNERMCCETNFSHKKRMAKL